MTPLVIELGSSVPLGRVWDVAHRAALVAGLEPQSARRHAASAEYDAILERSRHHRETPSDPDTFALEDAS